MEDEHKEKLSDQQSTLSPDATLLQPTLVLPVAATGESTQERTTPETKNPGSHEVRKRDDAGDGSGGSSSIRAQNETMPDVKVDELKSDSSEADEPKKNKSSTERLETGKLKTERSPNTLKAGLKIDGMNMDTLPDYTTSAYGSALLEILRRPKLSLDPSEKLLETTIFRLKDPDTGGHIANVSSILESTPGKSGIQVACVVANAANDVLMLIQMPLYNEEPRATAFSGGNEWAEIGRATVRNSRLTPGYDLELHGQKYAELKGSLLSSHYKVVRSTGSRQEVARVEHVAGANLPKRFDITYSSVESQDDLIARALVISALVHMEYTRIEGTNRGHRPMLDSADAAFKANARSLVMSSMSATLGI